MHARLAAVLALALLAGCGSVVGLGGQSTETVTPAPVPTASPTAEDPRVGIAPGVTAEGISDIEYLLRNHADVVEDRSYVWQERENTTFLSGNGSVTESGSQTIVVEDELTYRRNVSSLQRYSEGTRQFLNDYEVYASVDSKFTKYFAFGNANVTYEWSASPQSADQFASFPNSGYRRFFPTENVTVVRLEGGEQHRYELRGTRSTVPGYRGVENVTARAVIREDGFVEHVEATLVAETEFDPIRIEYESTYTTVGNVTVDEPAWVDDARESLGP